MAKNAIAQRRLDIDEAKLREEQQTADIKNYQYAVSQGYKGSFADFKNSTDTTTIKDYEYAVRQGYKGSYQDWRTEIAKAGGTNISIGEKVETARALGEVKNKAWFTSPEGMLADLDKLINTEDVQTLTAEDNQTYEAAAKKGYLAVVGGTSPTNVGKAHQIRANNFGVRLPSMDDADKIFGIVVTSKTEEELGLKGLMEHLYATDPGARARAAMPG